MRTLPLCLFLPASFLGLRSAETDIGSRRFANLPIPANITLQFHDRPGQCERSGKLVVRPRQVTALRERGLVRLQIEARRRAARDLVQRLAERFVPEVDEYIVPLPLGITEEEAASALLATDHFEYVEPDWIVHPLGVPDDPLFSRQWQWARIGAPAAWDLRSNSDVIVAICDTGVSTRHADIVQVAGYNVVEENTDSEDRIGHGTMCAGLAGARGNNGVGVVGSGPSLLIMSVRVTNAANGWTHLSRVTAGARWAARQGARVCSVSYRGVTAHTVETTGAFVRGQGASLVWAAGNDGLDVIGSDWPDVLVVGATDAHDELAEFSDRGPFIDLVAPGVEVLSTASPDLYAVGSGTSFAAPIVAGALGWILSVQPSLTPVQAEALLLETCDDLGARGEDDLFGRGRLSLRGAARCLKAAQVPLAPR